MQINENRNISQTLPRPPSLLTNNRSSTKESISFSKNNDIYWTIQTRRSKNDSADIQHQQDPYATYERKKTNKTNELSSFQSPSAFSDSKRNQNPFSISPIDPRNTGGFNTSTPSKTYERFDSPLKLLTEDLSIKLKLQDGAKTSNTSSPSSSGRSTPLRGILEPQAGRKVVDSKPESQTCSDRLGPSKTTLMDFKKLLLATSGSKTLPVARPSAVQQLKLVAQANKTQAENLNSSLNILELSGSPKTFANRRMNRQGVNLISNSSPKANMIKNNVSRTGWRMNNIRTNVMISAIPEANSEEEISNNLSEINKSANESLIFEENIDMRQNVFLKAEENNFMKHEIQQKNKPYFPSGQTRAQILQNQRKEFLMGHSPTNNRAFSSSNITISPNNFSGSKKSPSLETDL